MQPVQICIHSDMKFEETLENSQWEVFFLDSQEFLENSREISFLDLDLEAFSFHFSLSISISRHFHFTFHSRSRSQGICISLFILEMSESDFHFTFHFSNKKWRRIFFTFTSRTFNIHSRRTLYRNPKKCLRNLWMTPYHFFIISCWHFPRGRKDQRKSKSRLLYHKVTFSHDHIKPL